MRAETPGRERLVSERSLSLVEVMVEVLRRSVEIAIGLQYRGWALHAGDEEELILYKPVRTAREAEEALAEARRAAGLQDPLTTSYLCGERRNLYRALVQALGEQALEAAQTAEIPESHGLGWEHPAELARKAGAGIEKAVEELGHPLYLGYAEWRDGLYRAVPGTGAFYEALEWLPREARILLAPYSLGFTLWEWTKLEEPPRDVESLVAAVHAMEYAGVGLLGKLS